VVAGGATAVAGGAVGFAAYGRERAFLADPFSAPSYGDCGRTQACYAAEREAEIQAVGRSINTTYLVGYVLGAVGVGLVGVELFVLPAPTGAVAGVRVPLGGPR
jgi:hypothetical protein